MRQRWEPAMRRALRVAASAGPDVPIGAVVLGPGGTELGAAHNEREATGDPTAHAEILALRRAAGRLGAWRLEDCALVVTVEPCTMCAGALVLARIGIVVFGAWEPKIRKSSPSSRRRITRYASSDSTNSSDTVASGSVSRRRSVISSTSATPLRSSSAAAQLLEPRVTAAAKCDTVPPVGVRRYPRTLFEQIGGWRRASRRVVGESQ